MHLLITSAASQVGQWLAAALGNEHSLRLTDRAPLSSEQSQRGGDYVFAHSSLGHDFSTNLLVRGMEAIIHVAEPLADESPEQQIDYLTRGTYNLLRAAAEERVQRVVYLSTLSLMGQYDEVFNVNERWQPRPTTDPALLAKHLGESVCREFAREHKLTVIVLRLGAVVQAEAVAGQPFNSMWVDEQDVAQAVSQALTADVGVWTVCHIQAESPNARFPVTQARRILGYSPAIRFE